MAIALIMHKIPDGFVLSAVLSASRSNASFFSTVALLAIMTPLGSFPKSCGHRGGKVRSLTFALRRPDGLRAHGRHLQDPPELRSGVRCRDFPLHHRHGYASSSSSSSLLGFMLSRPWSGPSRAGIIPEIMGKETPKAIRNQALMAMVASYAAFLLVDTFFHAH